MRVLVQRVVKARVRVDERIIGEIGHGLLLFVGVSNDDTEKDVDYIAAKVPVLRVFEGRDGQPMDRSLRDVGGSVLVVSQFTLLAKTHGQRRPSFSEAAPSEKAKELYDKLVRQLQAMNINVATGKFRAMMQVELINDGPVTILIDSQRKR